MGEFIYLNEDESLTLYQQNAEAVYSLNLQYSWKKRIYLRSGVQLFKNNLRLFVSKHNDSPFPLSSSLFYDIYDVEIPFESRLNITKWFNVVLGVTVNLRLGSQNPSESLGPEDDRWPLEERIKNVNAAKHMLRPVLFKYRYGIAILPFKRVSIEALFTAPFGNMTKGSIRLRGEEYPTHVQYGVMTYMLKYRIPLKNSQTREP